MYVALKGFVLVAWTVAGGMVHPVSNFPDKEICETAKEQFIKSSENKFQAECLFGTVIAVVHQPDKKETKIIKDQIQPEEIIPNDDVPKLP